MTSKQRAITIVNQSTILDLITVLEAILTGRQSRDYNV